MGLLLPERIDNTYRGHKAALWIFALMVGLRIMQSLFVIFNGYAAVIGADGIPVDTYPHSATQNIVALFTLSGLYRLIIFLICLVVLLRYRTAVPAMFACSFLTL